MEIIKLKKMTKKELPSLYCSPLVPLETDEEAQVWAKSKGATCLYKYEGVLGTKYLISKEGAK